VCENIYAYVWINFYIKVLYIYVCTFSMLKICMKILQEWPLKSKLDPKIYGPPESAITTEMIQKEIGGIMTVKEVRNVTQYYDKTL
jgi:hypothetical protein